MAEFISKAELIAQPVLVPGLNTGSTGPVPLVSSPPMGQGLTLDQIVRALEQVNGIMEKGMAFVGQVQAMRANGARMMNAVGGTSQPQPSPQQAGVIDASGYTVIEAGSSPAQPQMLPPANPPAAQAPQPSYQAAPPVQLPPQPAPQPQITPEKQVKIAPVVEGGITMVPPEINQEEAKKILAEFMLELKKNPQLQFAPIGMVAQQFESDAAVRAQAEAAMMDKLSAWLPRLFMKKGA